VRLIYRVGGESSWPFPANRRIGAARTNSFPRHLVSTLFLARAIVDVIRGRRTIDVVHFHGDYLEALAAGAVRLLGIPSIVTLHGRLSPRVLRTVGFVYRLPSRIVAVSPSILAQLEQVGVAAAGVAIQPSGVNTEIFFPPQQVRAVPPFRIVIASALIPLKDHATLFAAVRRLQSEGLDVHLDVAGIGAEQERLERLAPPHTRFHGQLERWTLAELLRASHAAALASIDLATAGEGTPTFLMEALASGLPFVATDTGGIPQLAAQSCAGLVVPQRSPEDFAAALRILVEDRGAYESLRAAALAFAPRLDWEAVAERLDPVFAAAATRRVWS
jgi:teichuronic acid biosynthesis glycosyltransferase TuaC